MGQIISRGALEHEMKLKAHALRKLGIDIPLATGESGATVTLINRFTRDGTLHWQYHIAADEGTNTKVYIPTLLTSGTPNDPAFIVSRLTITQYQPFPHPSLHQDFVPRLKDHCIARLTNLELASEDLEYTNQDRDKLEIVNNTLYQHATAQFNFTTYDVQRERDVINTNTSKNDIIVASREDSVEGRHPFWYARVLAVFHTRVSHEPTKNVCKRIDVLFVRWFGLDPEWESRHERCRLDRVGFVPFGGDEDGPAFGFLDPATVVRGCHMIPAFEEGRTTSLLPPSRFRDAAGDYVNYYVNKCVISLHSPLEA